MFSAEDDLGVIFGLFLQPSKDRVNSNIAVGFVDCLREGDIHRADLYRILGVAAVSNSVLAKQSETQVARRPLLD